MLFGKNVSNRLGNFSPSSHNHDGVYEPVFSKNDAFNLNFGTTANTVAEGNHVHAGFVQDSVNEVISGAWTFTGIAEFGVAPQFTAVSGAPFTVAVTATSVVTNLNAYRLEGNAASAFATSGHTHTIYPSKTGTESITGAWTFGASGTVTFDTVPAFDNPALPFTVHANANLVTNLNADLLDGKHSNEVGQWTSSGGFTYLNTVSDNVGIGTSSPSAKLDISDSVPVLRLTDNRQLSEGNWDNVELGKIEFYTDDVSGVGAHIGASIIAYSTTRATTTPSFDLIFNTSDANVVASEKMRIGWDGQVGIGTATPSALLDVNGSFKADSITENGTLLTNKYEPKDTDITKANETESISGNWTFTAAGVTTFDNVPAFDGSILPFTVLATTGMVTNLDANYLNGFAESAFVRLSDSTPTTGYLYVQANTANAAIRARQDGAGYLQDWYDGATQRAYMTQAGLLVSDDFKGLSDERLKTKVEKVNSNSLLDKVLETANLIREYERIDKNNELELGWIAQSLYEIAPEYVHKPDNNDEMWAVGYSKMVVPLYGAIENISNRLKVIERTLGL